MLRVSLVHSKSILMKTDRRYSNMMTTTWIWNRIGFSFHPKCELPFNRRMVARYFFEGDQMKMGRLGFVVLHLVRVNFFFFARPPIKLLLLLRIFRSICMGNTRITCTQCYQFGGHWTKTILFISIYMNSTFLLCNLVSIRICIIFWLRAEFALHIFRPCSVFTIPDPELAPEQDEEKNAVQMIRTQQ